MNSDQVQGLIRGVLLGLGGILGNYGVVIPNETWVAIVGGVMALGGLLWSLWFHAGPTKSDAVSVAGGPAKIEAVVGK